MLLHLFCSLQLNKILSVWIIVHLLYHFLYWWTVTQFFKKKWSRLSLIWLTNLGSRPLWKGSLDRRSLRQPFVPEVGNQREINVSAQLLLLFFVFLSFFVNAHSRILTHRIVTQTFPVGLPMSTKLIKKFSQRYGQMFASIVILNPATLTIKISYHRSNGCDGVWMFHQFKILILYKY